MQIAIAYLKMKQFDKGIEYTNYAYVYLKDNSNNLAYLYNNYMDCYIAQKKSKYVLEYYKKIQLLVSKNDSLHLNISAANRSMAEFYIDQKKLNTAFDFAQKAVFFAQRSNDKVVTMEANIILGKVLFYRKEYKKAIHKLEAIAKTASEFDKESYITVNKLLSKSYAALGLWKKAYDYYDVYSVNNEILSMEYSKQSIANAEAKYQNKNKQQEISTLSAQNIIKNLALINATRQKIFLISALLLLSIIGGLLFYQSQDRKIINQKLQFLNYELDEANKIKSQFFGILNHDLRSPVYNLIHFLHIQKDNPELLDEVSKKRIEAKTIASAENLLVSMEDMLLWGKGQMENFKPKLQNVVVNTLFEDIKNHFISEENIIFTFENPDNLELHTDENYLKTIIRNLTSNAIKALAQTPNATIKWKSWQENGKKFLSISDNGSGASQEKFKALYDDTEVVGIKTGLGLHLIRDLAKAIHCTIEVTTVLNEGTTFKLLF